MDNWFSLHRLSRRSILAGMPSANLNHTDDMTEATEQSYRGTNSRKGHCGFVKTHGLRKSPEYGIWNSMKMRCLNPNNHKYPIYGGRGIKITPRWLEFQNFIADMGWRPSLKHTLERKDTDGDYTPYNCAWRTMKDQCRNKRNNVKITLNGETKCLKAWTEQLRLSYSLVQARLKRGWSLERAMA